MMPESSDETPIYEVRLTEPAEMELDAAYLARLHYGLSATDRWYGGLLREIESLAQMPRRFPIAPESDALGGGVRVLLYGKGRNAYRVLYRIIEPKEDNPGIVRVVHVRHAAQQLLGQDEDKT